MNTITEKLSNGNEITYKIVNDTAYSIETDDKIVSILEGARLSRIRLKLYYGDAKTGEDWGEEHDTIGYIGRSTGRIKIPILVYNNRSSGGGALLDHCIVKIKKATGGMVLYQNPNYKQPTVEVREGNDNDYKYETWVNGQLYGKHPTLKSAFSLKSKLS